jgi:VWFA-related protein
MVMTGLAVTSAVVTGARPQQRPAFRAATDVVFVDVAVRDEVGGLVGGLSAGDFVLTDNGVRQKIDSVEPVDLPIDLTLVADVSDSIIGLAGRPIGRIDPASFPRQIDDQVRRTAVMLRAEDRLRVLASGDYGVEVQPFAPAAELVRETQYRGPTGGQSSLHDTIVTALLHPVPVDRRHIVIARTKAFDTISAIAGDAIMKVAQRSPAMLHVVLMEAANDDAAEARRFQCGNAGICDPVRRFWVPYRRNSLAILTEAARVTGGAMHITEIFTEPSFANTFRKVLDDFRRSYVLRYTPDGVRREGWHDIVVTTPRSPRAVVHARRGYAIDATPAPGAGVTGANRPVAAPPAADAKIPAAADALIAAFERGQYDAVTMTLLTAPDPARLIRDALAAGNPWPASPAREGAFVLKLAEAGLFDPREEGREAARRLLMAHQVAIRDPLEPDAFEREWLFAELALLQGLLRPEMTGPFVENARERFPDEPRFKLAEAILADQLLRVPVKPPTDAQRAAVIAKYEAAAAHAVNTDEARVRLSWLLHRLGRTDEAILQLGSIADATSVDRPMRFFRQLFRGQLLASRDLNAAAGAFEAALTIWPTAQSARVGLMNTRVRQGDRAAAAALAEIIQTAPPDASDPWTRYWVGDYRFFDTTVRRMMEAR